MVSMCAKYVWFKRRVFVHYVTCFRWGIFGGVLGTTKNNHYCQLVEKMSQPIHSDACADI